ncbi:MAG: glycoside hydrolase family 3 N-terminal domain-containing protein [Ancrocorticia sp.]
MFSYASDIAPHGMFAAVCAATIVLTILLWFLAYRRLRPAASVSPGRKAAALLFAVALLLPAAFSGWMIRGYDAFGDAVAAFEGPTLAQQAAVEDSLAVNQKVMEEGAVLLENRERTLPLDPSDHPTINVFGMGSVKTQFTTSLRGADPRENPRIVPLADALEHVGFEVNRELTSFYESQLPPVGESVLYPMPGDKGNIIEIAPSSYAGLIESAADFSDVAIVVVTREGGEGGDLRLNMEGQPGGDAGKHYLELQDVERELLARVTERFDHVVVLINAANAMELGFLDDPAIDAALWIGEPGDNGLAGVAELLVGNVSPSGRLADTWAYDLTSAPYFKNFGDFRYIDDGDDALLDPIEPLSFASYVDYEEGIYVGYRYYETRWADDAGNVDEAAYASAVQYPFGYGLSYTSFAQEISGYTVGDGSAGVAPTDRVTMRVRVTNTGEVAGREVVQVYSQPPYYRDGIEKSRVELIGFGSTGILKPGESEEVAIDFSLEDLASYDYRTERAWVLEAGTYGIALQSNAHSEIDERSLEIPATWVFREDTDPAGGTTGDGGADSLAEETHLVGPRSTDQSAATNRFDAVSNGNGMIQLSRADWEGTEPTQRRPRKEATDELVASLADMTPHFPTTEAHFAVVPGDLTLADMTGLPADDRQWDAYLAQFTADELQTLVGRGGWVTDPIPEQGVPRSHSVDGPVGVVDYTTGTAGVGFASSVVLASTFDPDLARDFGRALAAEAVTLGYQGLYSPGINIHRSPFGGRNFEYYSEDPRLSGLMAAATVTGYRDGGAYAHIKHFAVNEQETNRQGVATWLNEQALREIYLRPFELAIKNGQAQALMGSYNRIGLTWTGGVRELNVGVLRDEWGFDGHLVTDFFFDTTMNVDQAIAGGVDLIESTTGDYPTEKTLGNGDGLIALRQSARHILYTFANSGVVDAHEPRVTRAEWIALGVIGGTYIVVAGVLLAVTRRVNERAQ